MKSLTLSYTLAACVIYVFSLTASAAEIHVTPGSPGIQAAIQSAADGDEIIVAPGIYQEHINFLGKAVTVLSTDSDDPDVVAATIIDGTSTGSCVTFENDEGPDSVLAGFTITNGQGLVQHWPNIGGGGVACKFSSPTIRSNIIRGNAAQYGAGVWTTVSSALITGNTIVGNSGVGILCSIKTKSGGSGPSNVLIVNNIIADNTEGGIEGTVLIISNNTITGNFGNSRGGGIRCRAEVIESNTISGNTAGVSGGGIYSEGNGLIANNIIAGNVALSSGGGLVAGRDGPLVIVGNVIAGNRAGMGGGISCSSDSLINNTVVSNRAAHGGGLYFHTGRSQLTNCIVWGNSTETYGWIPVTHVFLTLTNCLIEGGPETMQMREEAFMIQAEGIIDADPLFVDPGHWQDNGTPDDYADDFFVMGDYHLLPASPCIDAGTNDIDDPDTEPIEQLPETDLDGLPRILDGDADGTAIVDIGAYEYLPGDVNYDGKLNVLDLLHVRNNLGKDPSSYPAARRADVNADGKVDIMDLIAVRNLLSEW